MTLKDKHIILGITGSIAAYKAAYIIRGLVKKGAEVQVVITPAGKEFITPLTLSTLSSHPVISEFFSNRDGTWNSHVDLGLWADAMLIAPATASTIGKMANGIADNMLITTYLSCKSPVSWLRPWIWICSLIRVPNRIWSACVHSVTGLSNLPRGNWRAIWLVKAGWKNPIRLSRFWKTSFSLKKILKKKRS